MEVDQIRRTFAIVKYVGLLIVAFSGSLAFAQNATSPFSFAAWAAKDTFLTFETISYELHVKNTADTNVECRTLSPCDVYFRLFDQAGIELPHHELAIDRVSIDTDTLKPGDSTVSWTGVHVDLPDVTDKTQLGHGWLPPGAYKCVFSWTYALRPRDYISGDGQLNDTVNLWVVTPVENQESKVMEAYLNAMCRWQSALDTISDSKRRFEERREMLEAYREIADSFPSSVYSKQMRVEYIADLYQRVWVEGYNRRAATDYALTYIVDYPDEVSALRFVREFSNMGHERTELKFLRDVSAAVPGTRAGELAKRLLDHPDER